MLRRKTQSTEIAPSHTKGFVACPAPTEPFALGHAPAGIHFYQADEAFYCAYTTLQSMLLKGEILTLVFATDEIVIEGRGLHSLYAQIADQKIKRVHEQGERYEAADGATVFIRAIQRTSRNGILD